MFVSKPTHPSYTFTPGFSLNNDFLNNFLNTTTAGAAYKRGAQVTTLVLAAATLPLGVPVLVAVEMYCQLFSTTGPLQGAFWSAYENAKRVLEPLLEALPQALLQLAYILWRWRTKQLESLDSDFYITVASVAASVSQQYKIYHYLADLRVAYHLSWWGVVTDLLSLGSDSQAPFRFVLRSWAYVDFSVLLASRRRPQRHKHHCTDCGGARGQHQPQEAEIRHAPTLAGEDQGVGDGVKGQHRIAGV